MKIFVTGCLHGAWDLLIDTLNEHLKTEKIDLVIVTGDAETMRDENDLKSLACPEKYRHMGSFYKIYNRERSLPILTIMIAGNHEASNFLHVLPFGGWLAENLFYTGRANSVSFGDLSISAISGIFDGKSYFHPVDEHYPIQRLSDLHTCIHLRAFSDFQLFGLQNSSVVLSHDWPSSIASTYGGDYLATRKSYLITEDSAGRLGMRNGMKLLRKLTPSVWFAAHHHIRFNCTVEETMFEALPKPSSFGDWFTIADIPANPGPLKIRGQWISILRVTKSIMENPKVLRDKDWAEMWETLKSQMEACEDVDLGAYDPNMRDPMEITAMFCRRFGVYCPVKEVRDYIENAAAPKSGNAN